MRESRLADDPHELPRPAEGVVPTDALAVEQEDAAGVPAAPLPLAVFAAESSETVDGVPPHAVPRLAVVGTPGAASAVVHVDALVGSCADPTRRSDTPAAPVARDRIVARSFLSCNENVALARVATCGRSTRLGIRCAAVGRSRRIRRRRRCGRRRARSRARGARGGRRARAAARCGDVPLERITGSLDVMMAGPTVPGVSAAVPPAAGRSVLGRRSGVSDSAGRPRERRYRPDATTRSPQGPE